MSIRKFMVLAAMVLAAAGMSFAEEDEMVFDDFDSYHYEGRNNSGSSGGSSSVDFDNISEAFGNLVRTVGDGVKNGINKAKKESERYATISTTGKLVKKGKGDGLAVYLKSDDGKTYSLTTVTETKDSLIKLSGYSGKKVSIKGMLLKDTNEVRVISCKAL